MLEDFCFSAFSPSIRQKEWVKASILARLWSSTRLSPAFRIPCRLWQTYLLMNLLHYLIRKSAQSSPKIRRETKRAAKFASHKNILRSSRGSSSYANKRALNSWMFLSKKKKSRTENKILHMTFWLIVQYFWNEIFITLLFLLQLRINVFHRSKLLAFSHSLFVRLNS